MNIIPEQLSECSLRTCEFQEKNNTDCFNLIILHFFVIICIVYDVIPLYTRKNTRKNS
jgi:hypothetical protein